MALPLRAATATALTTTLFQQGSSVSGCLTLSGTVDATCSDTSVGGIDWVVSDGDTLSGSGTIKADIKCIDQEEDEWTGAGYIMLRSDDADATITIGENITLQTVDLTVNNPCTVVFNGKIYNPTADESQLITVGEGATLDISKGTISGKDEQFAMHADSTLICSNLSLTSTCGMNIIGSGVTINGNLTLSGGLYNGYMGNIEFDMQQIQTDAAWLTVNGSLTIGSGACISFYNQDVWTPPTTGTEVLFVNSITGSVADLAPYVTNVVPDSEEGTEEIAVPVTNMKFVARSITDGRTGIYLVDCSDPTSVTDLSSVVYTESGGYKYGSISGNLTASGTVNMTSTGLTWNAVDGDSLTGTAVLQAQPTDTGYGSLTIEAEDGAVVTIDKGISLNAIDLHIGYDSDTQSTVIFKGSMSSAATTDANMAVLDIRTGRTLDATEATLGNGIKLELDEGATLIYSTLNLNPLRKLGVYPLSSGGASDTAIVQGNVTLSGGVTDTCAALEFYGLPTTQGTKFGELSITGSLTIASESSVAFICGSWNSTGQTPQVGDHAYIPTSGTKLIHAASLSGNTADLLPYVDTITAAGENWATAYQRITDMKFISESDADGVSLYLVDCSDPTSATDLSTVVYTESYGYKNGTVSGNLTASGAVDMTSTYLMWNAVDGDSFTGNATLQGQPTDEKRGSIYAVVANGATATIGSGIALNDVDLHIGQNGTTGTNNSELVFSGSMSSAATTDTEMAELEINPGNTVDLTNAKLGNGLKIYMSDNTQIVCDTLTLRPERKLRIYSSGAADTVSPIIRGNVTLEGGVTDTCTALEFYGGTTFGLLTITGSLTIAETSSIGFNNYYGVQTDISTPTSGTKLIHAASLSGNTADLLPYVLTLTSTGEDWATLAYQRITNMKFISESDADGVSLYLVDCSDPTSATDLSTVVYTESYGYKNGTVSGNLTASGTVNMTSTSLTWNAVDGDSLTGTAVLQAQPTTTGYGSLTVEAEDGAVVTIDKGISLNAIDLHLGYDSDTQSTVIFKGSMSSAATTDANMAVLDIRTGRTLDATEATLGNGIKLELDEGATLIYSTLNLNPLRKLGVYPLSSGGASDTAIVQGNVTLSGAVTDTCAALEFYGLQTTQGTQFGELSITGSLTIASESSVAFICGSWNSTGQTPQVGDHAYIPTSGTKLIHAASLSGNTADLLPYVDTITATGENWATAYQRITNMKFISESDADGVSIYLVDCSDPTPEISTLTTEQFQQGSALSGSLELTGTVDATSSPTSVGGIDWTVSDGDTLSGSGTIKANIYCLDQETDEWTGAGYIMLRSDDADATITIGENITLQTVDLTVNNPCTVVFNGKIYNPTADECQLITVGEGATLDISKGTVSGKDEQFAMHADSTLACSNLSLTSTCGMNIIGSGVTINGNLTLSGGLYNGYMGNIEFDMQQIQTDAAWLTVNGSLTIGSGACISFYNQDVWTPPTDGTEVLVVNSITGNIADLAPYVTNVVPGEEEGTEEIAVPVTNMKFVAQSTADGRLGIYLVDCSEPVDPTKATDLADVEFTENAAEVSGNLTASTDIALPTGSILTWNAQNGNSLIGDAELSSEEPSAEIIVSVAPNGTVTIGNGITLDSVDLMLGQTGSTNSTVRILGTLAGSSSDERQVLDICPGYTADVTAATLGDGLDISLYTGSSLACSTLNLSSSRTLTVVNTGTGSANGVSLVKGNLSLSGGGTEAPLTFCGNTGGTYQMLTVSGTLTINSGAFAAFEAETAPDSGTELIFAGSLQGSTSDLLPYLYDAGSEQYTPVSDMKFISQSNTNGVALYLVNSNVEKMDGNTQIISSGTVTGDLGKGEQQLNIATDATVDATGVTSGLNNSNVKGTGDLLTADSQTLTLTGNTDVNFTLNKDVSAPGASVLVSGGKKTTNVTLRGSEYNASGVEIQGGALQLASSAHLTSQKAIAIASGAALDNGGIIDGNVALADGGSLVNTNTINGSVTVGNTAANNSGSISEVVAEDGAIVYNEGTIGDLSMKKGSTLRGNSTVTGTAVFEDGSTMHIGNSPGLQIYQGPTTIGAVTMEFTIDGTLAATGANDTEGTYSQVKFEGPVTINGPLTMSLNVTEGLLSELVQSGDDSAEFQLLDFGTTGTTLDPNNATITASGLSSLLEDYAIDSTGLLTAKVNKAAIAALSSSAAGDVVNTMWSAAETVKSFAELAGVQNLGLKAGQTQAWLAGNGNFTDMGGEQGFRYNGGGYALGVEHAMLDTLSAGVALGRSFGTFKSDNDRVKDDQDGTMVAVYGTYREKVGENTYELTAHAAYGSIDNDGKTYSAAQIGKADWDDDVFEAGLRATMLTDVSDNLSLGIFTGLDYVYVSQEDFSEQGALMSRRYTDGDMSLVRMPLGVTARGHFGLGGVQQLLPELTVAATADLYRSNPEATVTCLGFRSTAKGSDPGRAGLSLRVGTNWVMTESVSAGLFYNAEARDGESNQSINACVRYAF